MKPIGNWEDIIEDYAFLRENGETHERACERLNVKPKTLEKQLRNRQLTSLLRAS